MQTKIFDFVKKDSSKTVSGTSTKCLLENLCTKLEINTNIGSCQSPKFGSHMSIQNGFEKAVEKAKEKNYQCMQVFTRAPYEKAGRNTFSFEDAKKARDFASKHGIEIFIHASYAINLCRPVNKSNQYLTNILCDEFRYGSVLGAKGIVIHVGKLNTKDGQISKEDGYKNFVAHLHHILSKAIQNKKDGFDLPMLLIETAAGQGSEMPVTMEDLAVLWNKIDKQYKKHIGFCVDTCHIYASGECDVSKKEKINEFVVRFQDLIGWDHVKLLHFNDSKFGFRCKKDRHAPCDKGFIGKNGLHYFKNVCALCKIPIVKEYA